MFHVARNFKLAPKERKIFRSMRYFTFASEIRPVALKINRNVSISRAFKQMPTLKISSPGQYKSMSLRAAHHLSRIQYLRRGIHCTLASSFSRCISTSRICMKYRLYLSILGTTPIVHTDSYGCHSSRQPWPVWYRVERAFPILLSNP